MSDNGPQYASETFATFAKEYQFRHVTSSPGHAQANGEAERAVGTLKMLVLKKQDDPYLALLSYRSTPLRNGFSPAELLMSRKLRTTIPIIPAELKPKVPDLASLAEREERNNETIKESFDTRHQARLLSQLPAGTRVWIPDQKQFGSVISPASPPSYIVETPTSKIRRNRRSLNPVPDPYPQDRQQGTGEDSSPDGDFQEGNDDGKVDTSEGRSTQEEDNDGTRVSSNSSVSQTPPLGRISHPPDRLDL